MIEIDLGDKFVSATIPSVFEKFWKPSLNASNVVFKLDTLKWISGLGVSVFLSWVKHLQYLGKQVRVDLQSGNDISAKSKEFEYRRGCLERLLFKWRLKEHLDEHILRFQGIQVSVNQSFGGNNNFTHAPIMEYNVLTFDKDFDQIFEHYFGKFSMQLRKSIARTSIDYFDSSFLSYSILKELYSNAILHSELSTSNSCYFLAGLNGKFSGNSDFVSKSRIEELGDLDRAFFTDGQKYFNRDYIELNFHDFGCGISKSLKEKYLSESTEELKSFFGNHYEKHIAQHLDSRIIEYSILLFTSRYEIDKKLEVHDYIPRGLFILKDIVKKYGGYFEITSGCGGVSLSFKESKTLISYSNANNSDLLFPGTNVRIVFPGQEVAKTERAKSEFVRAQTYTGSKVFKHINFLEEFSTAERIVMLNQPDSQIVRKNNITAQLFNQFFKKFKSVKAYEIVMIDLAGVEPNTIDFFNKFIFFVTHFPLSGNSSLMLFNCATFGLNDTVIFDNINSLRTKGYLPYPIPCVLIDGTVEWLGVPDKELGAIFTEIWKGNDKHEYWHEDITRFSSNHLSVDKISTRYKVTINLPSYFEICQEILRAIESVIKRELTNEGIQFYLLDDGFGKNYNNTVIEKEDTHFLSSNGKYLTKYISFSEKLYLAAYRRMIANYFVARLFATDLGESKPKDINVILSVTLSSQLIGNEVREILKNLLNKDIKLIALSNYYNFQNEEKFSDLKPKEKVLIVNDVISTGNLTTNILKSIEVADAKPIACISIVDL